MLQRLTLKNCLGARLLRFTAIEHAKIFQREQTLFY